MKKKVIFLKKGVKNAIATQKCRNKATTVILQKGQKH